MDHLERFLCPETPQHHTRLSLSLSLSPPLSLGCHSGGQRESEQKSLLQRVKEHLSNQCSREVTAVGGGETGSGLKTVPSVGTQPKALWQWGLQVGLGEGKGG